MVICIIPFHVYYSSTYTKRLTSVSMICGWVDTNTMASIPIAHDTSMLGIHRDITAAVSHYKRVLLIMGVSM